MSRETRCRCDYCGKDVEIDPSKIIDWKFTECWFSFHLRPGSAASFQQDDIDSPDNICKPCALFLHRALDSAIKKITSQSKGITA